MLSDLQSICEEEIIYALSSDNVVEVLTNESILIPEASEKGIKEEAKYELINCFEMIAEADPDLEEKLISIKGLSLDLILHAKGSYRVGSDMKRWRKRRKSFNEETKKVRFNMGDESESD